MSLTSFLRKKSTADVRQRFNAEFTMPHLSAMPEMAAPPLTENYSLVGSAFDYLLRFYIQRLNPKASTQKWIAEEAVLDYESQKLNALLADAKSQHRKYLSSGKIDGKLLRSVLHLAQIDVLYRAGDDSYYGSVGIVDQKDIRDLRRLISLVQPKMFKTKKACVLNPTFGRASDLVWGADCDLVIDDALIEIKTTKISKVKRDYFDQLIGYYILFRIGRIKGLGKTHSIKRLGIYFSRHGYLWIFKVSDVIREKLSPKFLSWFKKRAKEEFSFA
jgi:hypothetical protein